MGAERLPSTEQIEARHVYRLIRDAEELPSRPFIYHNQVRTNVHKHINSIREKLDKVEGLLRDYYVCYQRNKRNHIRHILSVDLRKDLKQELGELAELVDETAKAAKIENIKRGKP